MGKKNRVSRCRLSSIAYRIFKMVIVNNTTISIVFLGTQGESETFLINGEPFPRLYEASSHLYVYASPQTLGEITYINIVCGANHRRKKWFLSSVHVIGISQLDRGKVSWLIERLFQIELKIQQ